MAKIIPANPVKPAIERVLELLRQSVPVALPTETVYGLAANAHDGIAVARVFALKNRPQFNPLICHVGDMAMAERTGVFDAVARKLAEAFWPGPLTLVLPQQPSSEVHELVTAGLGTVGIRWPQGFAAEVASILGKPLAAPSANKSGRVSPTLAAHVAEDFAADELLVVDDGPAVRGLESTIAKVHEGSITILRPGVITAEMLAKAAGVAVTSHSSHDDQAQGIEAPGMMASHYAPDATVVLDVDGCSQTDALLAFGARATPAREIAGHVLNLSSSGNLEEAASNLYTCLKELDGHSPKRIFVEPVPQEGIGLAINDRLKRAAAPR